MIFKFHSEDFQGTTHTTQFDKELLPEILTEITLFLRGCGYFLENLDYDVPSSGCRNQCISEGEPI